MEPEAKSGQPASTGRRNHRIAVGLLLLLIIYGSLYPFAWNFTQPQDFIYRGPLGLVDVVENVILFLPLGWLLAWHYQGQGGQRDGFLAWLPIALIVAGILQWLQKYLPRTPALSDIVFNMLGFTAGWLAGMISASSLNRLSRRHLNLHSADRFALVMVVLWVVAELYPFIPTLDRSSVAYNVKSLWQQDPWQPRRMLLHMAVTVIGLGALAQLVRSVAAERLARPLAAIATLAIVAGKFVVIYQAPGLPVVLGIAAGAAVWRGIDGMEERLCWWALLAIASAAYLLHAIWPLQWNDEPTAMRWLPFASSLSGSIGSVVTTVAFECLCFGAIIRSAVRNGASSGGITAFVATLAFACEFAQRYLPGRTAEITSVVLALGMGWLFAALSPIHRLRRGNPDH
ncbi:MAG: VanZ family protein [Dechloromonas sp.]|mgnify:CR=1 FL=1|nr:VanZ family protein [Thiobacillaceae bacterium]QLQ24218.1 MAG: VanZ family protein [Dechloromonas sp.]